jgi:hypothetical protein
MSKDGLTEWLKWQSTCLVPWVQNPVILATQEAEIRKIEVQSQYRQIVPETLSRKKKKKSQKRAGVVAQHEDPEFKPQYWKKKVTFQKAIPKLHVVVHTYYEYKQ